MAGIIHRNVLFQGEHVEARACFRRAGTEPDGSCLTVGRQVVQDCSLEEVQLGSGKVQLLARHVYLLSATGGSSRASEDAKRRKEKKMKEKEKKGEKVK